MVIYFFTIPINLKLTYGSFLLKEGKDYDKCINFRGKNINRSTHWKALLIYDLILKPGCSVHYWVSCAINNHKTGLLSSAAVVPQSKFTELCSSEFVVPQSKSTEMWSSAAQFHHDLWYFRHGTNEHFSFMLFIWKKLINQPTVAPLKSLKSIHSTKLLEKFLTRAAHTFHWLSLWWFPWNVWNLEVKCMRTSVQTQFIVPRHSSPQKISGLGL